MIFHKIGVVVVAILVLYFVAVKLLVPFIKSKKQKKVENLKKDEELKINKVELATEPAKYEETVNYDSKYNIPQIETGTETISDFQEMEEQNTEKKDEVVNKSKTLKEEIKNASPKLKAIIMSGVIQEHKYDE